MSRNILGTPRKGSTTVGTTSTEILAANAKRSHIYIHNNSNEEVFIAVGEAAVMNEGIRIAPKDSSGAIYVQDSQGISVEAFNAIGLTGGKVIVYTEIDVHE